MRRKNRDRLFRPGKLGRSMLRHYKGKDYIPS
jgi:hypothetical protein